VCFNCWSRGVGARCEMHLPPGEKDRPVPPGQSVLVCSNWDLAAIARKYRSEEIQEVFAKVSSSLRYDKNRRQFVSVLESRHPLYRALFDALAHHNERVRRLKRAKVWLRSIMEIVRVGLHGRGKGHKVPRLMRLKGTLDHLRCDSASDPAPNVDGTAACATTVSPASRWGYRSNNSEAFGPWILDVHW
jgi:hypothetical protein